MTEKENLRFSVFVCWLFAWLFFFFWSDCITYHLRLKLLLTIILREEFKNIKICPEKNVELTWLSCSLHIRF